MEEAHDPRLAEALAILESGIEDVLTSEGFQRYLEAVGRFHQYSPNNVLLIMAQRPDASIVAGYRRWQQLGRQVRRGESGISIITPRLRRERNPETDEEREVLVGYGTGRVFDISQTEGEPLPEPPQAREIESSSDVGFWLCDQLRDFLEADGVLIKLDDLDGPKGLYSPALKTVHLQVGMSADQTAKTLAHETAHHVALQHVSVPLPDAETIAESAAFAVLRHCGIDASEYSFPYVATWARDRQVLARNMMAIQRTAHTIIAGIDWDLPPALTRRTGP